MKDAESPESGARIYHYSEFPIPLTIVSEEMEFKLKHGTDKLLDKLEQAGNFLATTNLTRFTTWTR